MAKKTNENKESRTPSAIEEKQLKWCENDEVQKKILTMSYDMAHRRGEGDEGSKWYSVKEKDFKTLMAAEAEKRKKKEANQKVMKKLNKLYTQISDEEGDALDALLSCDLTKEKALLVAECSEVIERLPLLKKWHSLGLLDRLKDIAKEEYMKAYDNL